ncbi:serine/threonine-protein kinase [Actinomadura keratinilytica]
MMCRHIVRQAAPLKALVLPGVAFAPHSGPIPQAQSAPRVRDNGGSVGAGSEGTHDGRGAVAEGPSGRRGQGRRPLLAGRYRLGGVLGRGGMGTVWRAEDETLGRTVAVKELRFPSSIDEEEKRRLITRTLREAKAIARIRSNGAVTVYDVVDEDDRPWIVMELIEGKSLAEVIREDGTLTPKRAAEVGLAILGVLRAAHREGILHRDVKPSNVLIEGDDGRVVLTDFGIAQVEGDPSITSTGMLVGAPSYISPERARGHKPGPAADLWSLGGLLYAAVEGVPPYDKGSAIATLTAVMTEPLDPPKNAGPLSEVIYGLLAKDPGQRLDEAGARALLRDVIASEEAGAGQVADATKVVPLPKPADGTARESGRSWRRRRRRPRPRRRRRPRVPPVPPGLPRSGRRCRRPTTRRSFPGRRVARRGPHHGHRRGRAPARRAGLAHRRGLAALAAGGAGRRRAAGRGRARLRPHPGRRLRRRGRRGQGRRQERLGRGHRRRERGQGRRRQRPRAGRREGRRGRGRRQGRRQGRPGHRGRGRGQGRGR